MTTGDTTTDHDAARVAEIRAWASGDTAVLILTRTDVRMLLRLLDAAARPHDASFVTRAYHDEAVRQHLVLSDQIMADCKQAHERSADMERRAESAEAACARHVTAYDEVARRVVELEADRDEWRKMSTIATSMNDMLSERAERMAAALAASEAKMGVMQRALEGIGKKALHWQAVFAGNESLVHKWRDIQMRAQGAALRPAEEK